MKVIQVISRPNVGGLAVYVILATAELERLGNEAILVYGQTGPHEGNMMEFMTLPANLHMVFLPQLGREISLWKDLVALVKLIRLFRRERPDVVHTHASKPGVLGRLAAWLTRVPVRIHSHHGTLFHGRYFGRLKTRLLIAVERFFSRLATNIFVDTDTIKRDLLTFRIARPERIRTVTLGTDLFAFERLDDVQGRLRAHLRVPGDVPIVAIVARLVPIKRLDVFLAAAAIVLENTRARFVIAGDGELRDELLCNAREAGISRAVDFLGFWKDLREVYAAADVVVLCSDDEGSPIALIEAMAAGKPVVATRVGGVPDVIVDGVSGVLVPPRDPQSLADALLALIADPTRAAALGAAARARVFSQYSIAASLAKTEVVYRQLLLTSNKPGRKILSHDSPLTTHDSERTVP